MANNIIDVRNISFKYDDANKNAINDLSFSIDEGEWVSIIGKNGSGKTTLINLLDGLIKSNNGDIIVDNLKIDNKNLGDVRDKIGIVFQNPENQFVASTVKEDVAFGLENRQYNISKMHKIVDNSLKEVDMLKYKDSNPSKLSGGQQQRVALAGVIAILPKIIILDESTSMLDPKAKKVIINLINKLRIKNKLTVLSITHDMNEIQYSDRVLLLKDGNLIKNISPLKLFNELDDVENYGLEIPFSEKLRLQLKKNGFNIGNNYINDEEIVKWITQYYSKM
ncbi:energy-coupling factor transporter ATPase [Apilactobacillus micheneri]|uniref:Energy-coupling factor transporter ATPase n=1 Tax=Apilactobacillus micheneri TaxID=1899430 RepID=A0A9Q8IPA6_9LACO|nr:energy-coupling factor transporter ATPase [Apilactobacillus micheneri]TPR40877.1 energy-coupling factor transporter ATPase [Apilactobacillus micheneri]TPR42458.1 energy-coupling factor transporter ATPase [Apilactobacillus micheneri]TPR45427.1 energy-coupling factor transporter ATPase [Apilactobacillus micheneri]TPR45984.1 energy-coupling factor transporter ATPase [Apilactobacillus micheneri]TPR46669.1 energy-coupling factor transporter ATPase [Apilactobacillus micheneri]